MKKKLRFNKGIHTIHIPFILHDYYPWQEQVNEELRRFINEYEIGKSSKLGFTITESRAEITLYKY